MNKYSGNVFGIFSVKYTIRDNKGICFGGYCKSGYRTASERYLTDLRGALLVALRQNDGENIDEILYDVYCKNAPDYIIAIAISVDTGLTDGPCGGIIGLLSEGRAPADGTVEAGFPLCSIALPGGPGMIAVGSCVNLKSAFNALVLGENCIISDRNIVDLLKSFSIESAIICKDGSGTKNDGAIYIFDGNSLERLSTYVG